MSSEHLARICRVCAATPGVRHWLPTREYAHVVDYIASGGEVPPNLTIRLSAWMIGEKPSVPPELAHLPTSTVHERNLVQLGRRKDSIACRALLRDNSCGNCRACWEPKVKSVGYPFH